MRSLLIGAVVLGVCSAACFAGVQDFTLVNDTGVEINKVFISPSDKADWGGDILGKGTLPDGAASDIGFSPDVESELWDLKVEDSEGVSITWTQLNLPEITKVILHFENGEPTADVETVSDEEEEE